MLTPDYLTTSQSEECPHACNPLPLPVFINLSLKAMGSLGLLSLAALNPLLGALQ